MSTRWRTPATNGVHRAWRLFCGRKKGRRAGQASYFHWLRLPGCALDFLGGCGAGLSPRRRGTNRTLYPEILVSKGECCRGRPELHRVLAETQIVCHSEIPGRSGMSKGRDHFFEHQGTMKVNNNDTSGQMLRIHNEPGFCPWMSFAPCSHHRAAVSSSKPSLPFYRPRLSQVTSSPKTQLLFRVSCQGLP